MSKVPQVKCECGRPAHLAERAGRIVWMCDPCQAWVGVISTSKNYEPLGRLADRDLRYWKRRAQDAFDVLWKGAVERQVAGGVRAKAYQWLAAQLHITTSEMHFAKLTVEQCRRAYEICNAAAPAFLRKENA